MTAPLRFPNAPSLASADLLSRVRSFAPGFADGLGDRRVLLDSTGATSQEILQVNREFADSPEFERALRTRVEEVKHLEHPSLATVHAVERLEGLSLSLVSEHTAGRRVSELPTADCGPVFVLELIRAVTPALATLHNAGDRIAHGTLSAEQIVVASDGRMVVVDHVFGSAMEALRLSRARLIDLDLVVPAGIEPVPFDARTDMIQLGFLALSLFLRRPLSAADYPLRVPALLDEFVAETGSPTMAAKMRVWLERAMQIGPRPFPSAREALDAFGELPNEIEVQRAESALALLAFPSEVPAPPPPKREVSLPQPEILRVTPVDRRVDRPVAREMIAPVPPAPQTRTHSIGRATRWIIAGILLLATGEAVAILVLAYGRPPAVIEIRSPGGQVPEPPASTAPVPVPAARRSAIDSRGRARVPSVPSKPANVPPAPAISPRAPAIAPRVAAGPRVGGLTVSSPIDLEVFKDGKLVGSTAASIAVGGGFHSLEFLNETLGFRLSQTVSVRNGQMTSLNIPVPNGRISINATPWAELTIDGTPAGETPLANLALPIGTHEIVFRHPELGERRQTIVVKVGALLRVTQAFQQAFRR